jgi:hypothetical protein
MDVIHSSVSVSFSKNLLKNLFNNLIVKKKLILAFLNFSFYGRSLFFLSDVSELSLSVSNMELFGFYKLNYFLYNRWFLNKKFSPFIRKFQRNGFFYYYYLNKIAFLSNFGLNFIYQKFSFFFRHQFYNLN